MSQPLDYGEKKHAFMSVWWIPLRLVSTRCLYC